MKNERNEERFRHEEAREKTGAGREGARGRREQGQGNAMTTNTAVHGLSQDVQVHCAVLCTAFDTRRAR